MNPRQERNSGSSRRRSGDAPIASPGLSDHDVNNYDLSDVTVADGFRPMPESSQSTATAAVAAGSSAPPRSLQMPPPMASPAIKRTQTFNRPSSISKATRPHDSLTLRHDGTTNTSGFSGPAYPYQMFPQRTTNDGNTPHHHPSTNSYHGPRGPSHPYDQFSQTTNAAGSRDSGSFRGIGTPYQRHLQAANDAEADHMMMEALGEHSEDLPPYTRYPEQDFNHQDPTRPPANPFDDIMATTESLGDSNNIEPSTRPARTSQPLSLSLGQGPSAQPESVPGIRTTEDEDGAGLAGQDESMLEKREPTKWQRRAQRKCCGIVPYWAICLLITAFVIMGIVAGAVVGTVLHHDHKTEEPDNDNNNIKYDPKSSMADIQPLTTVNPFLPPLPTGFFALPPLDVSQSPKRCFEDTRQAQAWSCQMPYRYYQLEVEEKLNASGVENYSLKLTPINRTDSRFIWGAQAPSVPEPMGLRLVNDTFETGRGPAWWLKVSYSKVVVVPEKDFPGDLGQSKRDFYKSNAVTYSTDPYRYHTASLGAEEGDRPWICTWPDTMLEIFIYPRQDTSLDSGTTTSSTACATSTEAIVAGTDAPSGDDHDDYDDASPANADAGSLPFQPPPPYPKVVKMLERRYITDSTDGAFCSQVMVTEGGYDSQPVVDSQNRPVQVTISEKMSTWEEQLAQYQRNRHHWNERGSDGHSDLERRDLEMTDCACGWWST